VCNEETGGPCEEFEPGELQQCPVDKSSGCLISKLTIGDVTGPGKYTRSCSGSKPFPCRDYQGDQDEEFIHECVCGGDGCNKDWASAGDDTTNTTPNPGDGQQCYRCSTLEGAECSDFVTGEPVTCQAPMDKGCFISHEDDVYIRDCADSTEYTCDDNKNGRMCTCKEDLCNEDFYKAGDTPTTPTKEPATTSDGGLQCFKCNSLDGDCDSTHMGKIANCDINKGCLISYESTAGAKNVYVRDCAQGEGKHNCDKVDSGTSVLRFCICDDNLCNESWNSAGSTTVHPTGRPTEGPTHEPTQWTEPTTTTTTTTTASSATLSTLVYPVCTLLFITSFHLWTSYKFKTC